MEKVTINPTVEPPEQTLGGHRQNLVRGRTREKGALTPLATDPDLPVSFQESPGEAGVGGGLLQGLGQSVAVHAWDLLKVTIIFTTYTVVLLQVKQQGGNTAPPNNRKLD